MDASLPTHLLRSYFQLTTFIACDFRSYPRRREAGTKRGNALERIKSRSVIVDMRSDYEFIGISDLDKLLQTSRHSFGRAHRRNHKRLARIGFFRGRPEGVDVINRRRNLSRRAASKIGEGLL